MARASKNSALNEMSGQLGKQLLMSFSKDFIVKQ
jgi:hypothetical protein